MPRRLFLRLFFLATACTPAAPPLPANDAVSPVKVATLPGYTEGVVIDADRTIYVSGADGDRMGPGGLYRLWLRVRGRPSGARPRP